MKKVLLIAPILSRSGYGEMARFAFKSLMNDKNVDLYLHSINWGKTGWIWKDDDTRRLIDSTLQKTVMYRQNGGNFDASVQCTIPNEWQKITSHDVGYTAGIETDKVASEWVVKGNEVDKIVTISKHSADVYRNTTYDGRNETTGEEIKDFSCETPITHVGFPVKEVSGTPLDINPKHDFNFLCVAQLGPRKNVDAVIRNFGEEFKDEEVGLIMKINGANDSVKDFHGIKSMFNGVAEEFKNEGYKCSISLLHGNLTDEQMHGLYNHDKVKAIVSFTHGEGFGLPLYEAAYSGVPVIATDWSGHLDFLTVEQTRKGKGTSRRKMFAPVKYKLEEIPPQAVWKGVLTEGSRWAVIDDTDAKKKLRDVYKNHAKWQKKATTLRNKLCKDKTFYEEFVEQCAFPSVTEDVL